MRHCGRAVGWRRLFSNFPIKHNRWLPPHFLLGRVNQNFTVDDACRGKGNLPKENALLQELQAVSKSCIDLSGGMAKVREYFFGMEVSCFQIGLFVICWCRSVEYEGALQLLTKCNLVKACKVVTEGANPVCLMEDACRRERGIFTCGHTTKNVTVTGSCFGFRND